MPRRKIPTKAELIQLQKLYKTDEKIAERIGNVTPQLVAYWRRKKNIPKHSFPKFSDSEIRDIWERYGDDYRCGLELGISKAAFYNWRRRYNLKEKPSFLKLEQLELNLGGHGKTAGIRQNYGGRTVCLKILAERAGKDSVEVGEPIEVEPDIVLTRGDTATILENFEKSGHSHVFNPNRMVISLDRCGVDIGDVPSGHRRIKDFIRKQNIKNYFDVLEGCCHQLVIERGLVLPGQLAIGTDRRISSFGSVDSFATLIDADEMARVWTEGKVRITVPPTVRIIINGKMPPGVYARDVILFIARKLTSSTAAGKAIEFNGAAVSHMSISERFTLADLAGEMGVTSAICSFDSTTRRYLSGRTRMPYRPALADKDALYYESYEFNITHLIPQIACPHQIDKVESVADMAGSPINQVIIGGTANGRFDDLRQAADILQGRKISPGIRTVIIPASQAVYLEADKKGLIRAFIESGAVVASPGFESYLYTGGGILAAGERCLSTTSCNRQGVMGSPESEVYLVSPATAAASAIKGVITDPTGYVK